MLTLDDLIAFNEELSALVRAGVPLEPTLSALGGDAEHQFARIHAAVGRRLSRGESLAAAIGAEDDALPAVYQQVVQAGLRCGSLPVALESLSRFARAATEMRNTIRSALIYPLLVICLAYVLFVVLLQTTLPTMFDLFQSFGVADGMVLGTCRYLARTMAVWVWLPPALFVACLLLGARSGSGAARVFERMELMRWIPGISGTVQDYHYSSFCELLSVLVEHQVPLGESLRLAGGACGSRRLERVARAMSERWERGELAARGERAEANIAGNIAANIAGTGTGDTRSAAAEPGRSGGDRFPPFLEWILASPSNCTEAGEPDQQGTQGRSHAAAGASVWPVPLLRLAADTYRSRAERRAAWLRTVLPWVACVVLGGGVTLWYCLAVFMPLVGLLRNLA